LSDLKEGTDMKRFFVLLVLIGAGVVALGFHRGWFQFTSDTGGDKSNMTLTVDKGKVQEDKAKLSGKAESLGYQVKDKAVATTEKGS
jgi:hypothetical protein